MEAGPGSDPAPRPVQAPPRPVWAARLRRKEAGSPRGRGPWTPGFFGGGRRPPPLPLCRPRPEDARLGRAAGGDLALRPRQLCGRGGLSVPGWEARAACAALDPRLLLPRAVRAQLTQRNTLHTPSLASRTGPRLPFCLPGAASRAPLRDAAVTHTDTSQPQYCVQEPLATWVTGRQTVSGMSARAGRLGGQRRQRGRQESSGPEQRPAGVRKP